MESSRYELAFFIGPCSEAERDALAERILDLAEFKTVGGGGIGMTPVTEADHPAASWLDMLLNLADGTLADPCWCGEDWWTEHDVDADPREHAEWCLTAREVAGVA